MKTLQFEKRTRLDVPAQVVFDWHMAPGALEKLIPPGDRVEVLEGAGQTLSEGSRVTLRVGGRILGRKWVAEHRDIVPGRQFRDVMIKGPFAHWDHTHRFEPDGDDACHLIDRIEYAPPFGFLGRLLLSGFLRRKLEATFEYRHAVTERELSKGAAT